MDSFKNAFGNLAGWVGRMTPSQVMMLFGLIAGSIVGVVLLTGWLRTANYSRLVSNLEASEASEVVQYLTDNKIPYQLTESGTSIDVPSDQVYSARLGLASQGLPKGGTIGYSIFDNNTLGMTDFLQNLNFRRALEGELTKTIMALNGVKAARVHLTMPKERLFKADKKEPTASVVLKLSHRDALDKQQLAGITHLVASSVEGLSPANVSIIDYDGNLISGGRKNDVIAGLSDTQLEVRKNVEDYLQSKAQSILDGVLGQGKSIVRLTADLNFQQIERTSESYDPNTQVVRSEEKTKSSNATTDKAPEASESNEQGSTETNVVNYEISKSVEHIVNAVGSIDRLSIAVMVDGLYAVPEGAAEDTPPAYQPRNQEDLDRLAAVVKNAVGFDPQRNDQIEMVNLPFDRETLVQDQEALDSMYQREFIMELVKIGGTVLLILVALLWIRKKVKALFSALGKISSQPGPHLTAASQMQEAVEQEQIVEAPELPQVRRPRLTDQMQTTAKQHPDEIARVIRTMMAD